MNIETERLMITEFTLDMAQVVKENSVDEDNKRFVPDEVWETKEEAEEVLKFLISQYGSFDGPFVYPIIVKATNDNIGYVQLCPINDGRWEIGYHIAKKYTRSGYATEAVKAFLPVIAGRVNISEIYGISLAENKASLAVMRKCGFENVFTGMGLYQGAKQEIVKTVWKSGFTVRKLEEHETQEALSLAWEVFSEYESPDYSPEGTEEFLKCLHDEKYLAGIEYYGAFNSGTLIGLVGIRKDKCHICFFFVDGKYHRLGIGTKLFERIKTEYLGKTITLNSSPYGLPFYKSLGFHETDAEQTVNGIRFTPMTVQIKRNGEWK